MTGTDAQSLRSHLHSCAYPFHRHSSTIRAVTFVHYCITVLLSFTPLLTSLVLQEGILLPYLLHLVSPTCPRIIRSAIELHHPHCLRLRVLTSIPTYLVQPLGDQSHATHSLTKRKPPNPTILIKGQHRQSKERQAWLNRSRCTGMLQYFLYVSIDNSFTIQPSKLWKTLKFANGISVEQLIP